LCGLPTVHPKSTFHLLWHLFWHALAGHQFLHRSDDSVARAGRIWMVYRGFANGLPAAMALGLFCLPVKKVLAANDPTLPAEPAADLGTGGQNGAMPGVGITLLEAVRVTLSRSQNILIQDAQADESRGSLLAAKGAFDTHLVGTGSHGDQREPNLPYPVKSAATSPVILPAYDLVTGLPIAGVGVVIPGSPAQPAGPQVFDQSITTMDVGLNRTLGNGSQVSLDGIYNRENEGPLGPILNLSELRLTLQVPVLRFLTPSDQAYQVRSDADQYAAEILTYRHVVSQAILQTAQAYWALRSAQEQLDLLRAYEDTSLSLRKLISVLIAGDEKAKSEIQQADAYVAQAVGRRLAGEQAVFEARQALGVAMGLDRAGLRYAPLAAEPFPGPNGLEHVSNNQDRLIAAALELRADYRASIKAQESAQAIMDAARLDLLPQMNFQIKASSFGGDTDVSFQGFEHSFFGHQTGVSAVGQLQFDWPIENRVARGNFVTTTAEKRQAEVQTSQLESNIVSGVLVSIDALMSGARQWLEAREAVSAYERATDTEEKKYKAGVSTLLDVIDTEDRELEEMLTEVTARQQIAVAYAQLRFQSGTMLTGDGKSVDITPDVLETVPSVAQVPPPGPLFRFKGSAQAR